MSVCKEIEDWVVVASEDAGDVIDVTTEPITPPASQVRIRKRSSVEKSVLEVLPGPTLAPSVKGDNTLCGPTTDMKSESLQTCAVAFISYLYEFLLILRMALKEFINKEIFPLLERTKAVKWKALCSSAAMSLWETVTLGKDFFTCTFKMCITALQEDIERFKLDEFPKTTLLYVGTFAFVSSILLICML